jgi:transketolase
MNKPLNYRKDVLNLLLEHARKDEQIVLLVGDMGFGSIDSFKNEMPHRLYNFGIMEQGMVGIAAGMAMSGLKPVVYSIVNFLVFRSLEQIRNDVILQNLNVKFIATGVNDYFKFLGSSHCCGEDDKEIMKLVNMPVFDPYAERSAEFKKMVEDFITSPKAGYIRV